MNESETFGAEKDFAEMIITWMNEEAVKRKVKFEARLYGYTITTENFGTFEMFSWMGDVKACLLYTSPSPRDRTRSRMPSSA